MLNRRRIALGAVVLLAGCGHDPSGPATPPDLLPVDRTANLDGSITVNLSITGPDAQAVDVLFQLIAGKKVKEFTLDLDETDPTFPSTIVLTHLKPGQYLLGQPRIEGFSGDLVSCTTTAGSTAQSGAAGLVAINLAKKGQVQCTFTLTENT